MPHAFLLLILCAIGFIAGIIDTLAGGGGLITLPALLAIGLPPSIALGTNKLQGVVGELTASTRFFLKKKMQFKDIGLGVCCVVFSSSLGAITVQHLHPTLLEKVIPFFLLAILIYIILAPRLIKVQLNARLSEKAFYIIVGFFIGFYNGFLGPGTGSFWTFAFIVLLNYSIVNATIHTKPLNAAGNLASIFWFVLAGNIDYSLALVMALGQLMGAYIAANWVIYKGHWLIRPVFILVVSLMTILLFLKNYS